MFRFGSTLLSPALAGPVEPPEQLATAALVQTPVILTASHKASLERLYAGVCLYLDERKRHVGRRAFTAGELALIARSAPEDCQVMEDDILVGAEFPCALVKSGEVLAINLSGDDLRAHVLDVLTRLETAGGKVDGMSIANLADLVALQFMASYRLIDAKWPVRLANPVDTKSPHMGADLRLTPAGVVFARLLRPQGLLPLARSSEVLAADDSEEDRQVEAMS